MKKQNIIRFLILLIGLNFLSCYTFMNIKKYNQKKENTTDFTSWNMPGGNSLRYNYNPEEIKLPLQKTFFKKHQSVLAGQPLISNSTAALPLIVGEVMFLTYDSLLELGTKRLAYGIDHSGAVNDDYFYIPNALGNYSVKEFRMVKFPETRSLGLKHTSSGILFHDNYLFYLENGKTGKVFNLENGEFIWECKFEEISLGEPVLSGDVLYLAFINGNVKAVNWLTGKILWEQNIGSTIRNNPLIIGNSVFVFSKTGKWAELSRETGEVVWNMKMYAVTASPSSDGELIYIASTNNKLYAFNPNDRKIIWTFTTKGVLTDQPFVTKTHVIIGSWDKKVYVINKKNGEMEFEETFKKPVKSGLLYVNGKLYINVANRGTYIYESSK